MKNTNTFVVPNRDIQIKKAYTSGTSLRDLAGMFRLSHEGVRKILKRNGVKMRPLGTNRYSKLKG